MERCLRAGFRQLEEQRTRQARQSFGRVLRVNPGHAPALHAMGMSYAMDGKTELACEWFEKAVDQKRDVSRWHRDLGVACCSLKRWRRAVIALRRATELNPRDSAARLHYGYALNGAGQTSKAELVLKAPFHLESEQAQAYGWMAQWARLRGDGERALQLAQLAAAMAPLSFVHQARLAMALGDLGMMDEAREQCFRALNCQIDDEQVHSCLLVALVHCPGISPHGLRDLHEDWAVRHAAPVLEKPRGPALARRRKLRVGFPSGEFSATQSHFFMAQLFANFDRRHLEIFGYHTRGDEAPHLDYYQQVIPHFRQVGGLSSNDIAAMVRRDRIDVLVDLAGHHVFNCTGVMHRRSAPVQVAYLNYPSTTGLNTIDYLLTDRWTSPEGTESEYSEKLYRLPSGYIVFQPWRGCPPVKPLPALKQRRVTFGVFQRMSKLNSGVLDAIAAVLHAVPRSQVLFHQSVPQLDVESPERARLREAMRERDVKEERVLFRGRISVLRHLALVSEVDIALDSFPYSGQTTTCECLWMGVPVVTLRGDRHAARVSAGLLERAGLGTWVAETLDEYVHIAATLAADLEGLAKSRAGLRRRIAQSSLTDGATLAKEVEQALWWMWERQAPNA